MSADVERALSLARDILGGDTRAVWEADWPHALARGTVDLELAARALVERLDEVWEISDANAELDELRSALGIVRAEL